MAPLKLGAHQVYEIHATSVTFYALNVSTRRIIAVVVEIVELKRFTGAPRLG